MSRPAMIETLMSMALTMGQRSTCSRAQVGVLLISKDRRILGSGYNGAPAGQPHCVHADDERCEVAVHAEANAIAYAARHGVRIEGAELVTTLDPCHICARLVISAGISVVWSGAEYRKADGVQLLNMAGIHVRRVPLEHL